MADALRSWIIGIAGAAMVTAAAMTVTPEGRVKKAVSLICGLMTVIALIRPVTGFDYTGLARSIARYESDAEAFSSNIGSANENLTRRIIEDNCRAYILDKGQSLGITDLEAAVATVPGDDGGWYPGGAVLTTDAGADQREKLGQSITGELGIPPEELIWRMHHES